MKENIVIVGEKTTQKQEYKNFYAISIYDKKANCSFLTAEHANTKKQAIKIAKNRLFQDLSFFNRSSDFVFEIIDEIKHSYNRNERRQKELCFSCIK